MNITFSEIKNKFGFLKAVNEFLESKGIPQPLDGQATTTTANRRVLHRREH